MFNRRSLLNSLKNILLEYIDHIPLSLDVKRIWLRSLHYILPLLQILLITFGNKFMFFIGVSLTTFITSLFFILNGCILSSIERKLFNDDSNITDICLELLKLDKTVINQIRITQISMLLIALYIYFIYNYRFT